jgi:predicted lipoprotein with Yx(FWY)xxD motif
MQTSSAIRSTPSAVHPGIHRNEEAHHMQHTDRHRRSTWRASAGRIAAAALAIGGLSAAVVAPGIAGAATTPRTATEIATAKSDKLGTYLVADDLTVYTLKPSKTACTAKCLKAWPLVLLPEGATAATAGTGVNASKLGTKTLSNGNVQVTYSGKPLYWFHKDKTPGQVKGNIKDKWGKWATVVTVKSSSSSSGSGSTDTTGNPSAF